MSIEQFSKEILNKDIPLNTLKICFYLLSQEENELDIDKLCSTMYITKMKLVNEIKKIRNIEGYFSWDLNDTNYIFYILDKKYTLKSEKKKKKKKNEETKEIKDKLEATIVRIFEFWRLTMNKSSRTKLDQARRKQIVTALQKYTEEECLLAILGCSKNPWNMGHNPRQKEYNTLELIFRTSDHTEGFITEANGLSLEEKIELENNSKPRKIEDRFNDNEWCENKLSNLEETMGKQESNSLEHKNKEMLQLSHNDKSYNVKGLADYSLFYLGFEKENVVDNIDDVEIIEEEADFEIIEEDKEGEMHVPLYMQIAKDKKNK